MGIAEVNLTILSIVTALGILISFILQFPKDKRRRKISKFYEEINLEQKKLDIATAHQNRVEEKQNLVKEVMDEYNKKRNILLKEKEDKIQQEQPRIKSIIDDAESKWNSLQDRWSQLSKQMVFQVIYNNFIN